MDYTWAISQFSVSGCARLMADKGRVFRGVRNDRNNAFRTYSSLSSIQAIWVVVKIRVPCWVPQIIGAVL